LAVVLNVPVVPVPAIVPPSSVAVLVVANEPVNSKVPALALTVPVNVFEFDSVSVPEPFLTIASVTSLVDPIRPENVVLVLSLPTVSVFATAPLPNCIVPAPVSDPTVEFLSDMASVMVELTVSSESAVIAPSRVLVTDAPERIRLS